MAVGIVKHIEHQNVGDSLSNLFFARKQLLLLARLIHRNSVGLSVRPSVCHTGGSVKNGASYDHQILTVGCLEDSSFRNRKAFFVNSKGVTPNEGAK